MMGIDRNAQIESPVAIVSRDLGGLILTAQRATDLLALAYRHPYAGCVDNNGP